METGKLMPGEKEAVRQILAYAKGYGYGNLIAHLKRAWAISLKEKYGGQYRKHLQATEVDAYPEEWDIEKL